MTERKYHHGRLVVDPRSGRYFIGGVGHSFRFDSERELPEPIRFEMIDAALTIARDKDYHRREDRENLGYHGDVFASLDGKEIKADVSEAS